MGASKQKQLRVKEREKEISPKERAAQQAAAEKKKTKTRNTIGVVVIVIVALLAGLINSSLFDTRLTAVKIGDTGYSLAQVRYAKQLAYTQFVNNYSGIMDYLIDSETPLSEQTCSFDQSMSWDEYFTEESLKFLQEMSAYYKLAEADGYTLSEEDQNSIEDSIAAYGEYAKMYGYTTDGYLTAMYGEGNSVRSVRDMMKKSLLSGDYAQDRQDSFTDSYTAEELNAWYEENAKDYNKITYLTAAVDMEMDADGNVTEEAKAAAKATVDAILEQCDGTAEGFSAAVLSLTDLEATEDSAVPSTMGEAADWFSAAERKSGDVTSVEVDSEFDLYCYISADTNDYKTANVRHILVKTVDADEDGSISEEEKQTALDTITAIKEAWDGTEEGFASLANEKSEDTGSNTNGGLYENVYKGQMVSAFDDFCFGGRKSGDNEIVYDETYGYFFIYYVGEGDTYRDVLAKNAKTSEDFTAWKDALLEDYPIEKKALFKKL